MTTAPALPAQREREGAPQAADPADGISAVVRGVPGSQLQRTLRVLRRGTGDPTYRVEYGPEDGPVRAVWRVARTPQGPATLRARLRSGGGGGSAGSDGDGAGDRETGAGGDAADEVELTAWGDGAAWLLQQGPAMLGAEDDLTGFAEIAATHPLLADAHRRRPSLRLIRTGLMLEALIPAILEQKVTTQSAYSAWRRLVRANGEPAPGPASMPPDMYVSPTPHAWIMIPSWEWRRAEVDGKRAEAIIRACRRAAAIERLARADVEEASSKLRTIPGIGPWTAAETLQRSHGAADLVSVGDLHLPRLICGILGDPADRSYDDAKMLALLAPFAPHRQRAVRLLLSRR
ncbi:MAG TPA: DNA-3-methyladenine glycosylase 2 family protein [Actinospica sp.]|nr:DNA-3-methyladenine glycosylase 2 family protein [Actinospica sp.]